MPVSPGFREHVLELLEPLGDLKPKRFFGGVGLYLKEKLIGFLMEDRIYLKADDRSRPLFEREGAKPFTYTKRQTQEVASINYYEVPAHILEDSDAVLNWSRRAFDAALSGAKKKPAKRRTSGALPADLPLVAPKSAAIKKVAAKKIAVKKR